MGRSKKGNRKNNIKCTPKKKKSQPRVWNPETLKRETKLRRTRYATAVKAKRDEMFFFFDDEETDMFEKMFGITRKHFDVLYDLCKNALEPIGGNAKNVFNSVFLASAMVGSVVGA